MLPKLKLETIVVIITGLGLIFASTGTLIINQHLAKYNISDFSILQPRSILVGFFYCIILVFHVVFYYLYIDLKRIEDNTFRHIFFITLIKIILVTNWLSLILDYVDFSNKLVSLAFTAQMFLIVPYTISYEELTFNKHSKFTRFFLIPTKYIGIIGLITYAIINFNNTRYQNLFWYEVGLAFLILIFFFGMLARAKDVQKGFVRRNISLFTKAEGESPTFWDKVALIIYMIFLMVMTLKKYSGNIYPDLTYASGGGKVNRISFVTDTKDTISGQIIHQSEKNIFVMKDSIIHKIEWEKVTLLLPTK